MGCNCASREYIEKLHSLYGEKINPTTGLTFKFRLIKIINTIGVYIAMLFLAPILLLFILFKTFSKDKKISIRKVLGLKERNENLEKVFAENVLKNIKKDE